ncbi:plasmid pRiA4b ORF-3 family protein [Escherichia coli]|nr:MULTISPECIES: plasmid pRiA4b ORF-3 family protein [Escherichia]EFN8663035.1 plasmid pRiA4b ORF-3 family protein [Escherichia coli O2]EHY2112046.1 plasmid pRiA4b ORF-3 family protein [Escherichia coli O157]EJT2829773.1 plasmid pRiA4b ORF-3 family protein [Shigella boydii]EKF4355158.1 plasmid pRiA4b ORF-3 family protein [Escherichia coli O136]EKH5948000.1 plasmid pRiA4b ORF-3 family protein [Escherichia coli O103]HDQ6587291.1 plasmid pRiA4b ORF-3 family protein [Escherichia coli O187:H28]
MMPLLVMKVYVIKIAVRGVSPMVWRRLRIAADTSLAALHFIIQIIQGWGDDHLHQFHIYGKDYGITYEGSIGFPDKPETGSARRGTGRKYDD